LIRIKTIPEKHATGIVKEVYSHYPKLEGFTDPYFEVLSLWPEWMKVEDEIESLMFGQSELSRQLKEMIITAVSQINDCEYCMDWHAADLKQTGLRDEEVQKFLDGKWREVSMDEKARAIVDYAEKLTVAATTVTDEDVENLKKLGFSDRQILEATIMACHTNYANRLMDALNAKPRPYRYLKEGIGFRKSHS
jgi:uncharacterized peroxidase-related enzyme